VFYFTLKVSNLGFRLGDSCLVGDEKGPGGFPGSASEFLQQIVSKSGYFLVASADGVGIMMNSRDFNARRRKYRIVI
jgi:hypothetical protein